MCLAAIGAGTVIPMIPNTLLLNVALRDGHLEGLRLFVSGIMRHSTKIARNPPDCLLRSDRAEGRPAEQFHAQIIQLPPSIFPRYRLKTGKNFGERAFRQLRLPPSGVIVA